MALGYRDDLIQQVPPTTLDPTFRDTVLPRTLKQSSDRTDSEDTHRCRNLDSILAITVKEEEGERIQTETLPATAGRPAGSSDAW
jgi:hypothetical protein